ncbi:hypothetical protein [Sphingomonas sp.]|uniref:hypothetical protein n=1 Tax=Sphingomonas sp. TaxID=28214 RepID=UPI003CC5932B
MTKRRSLSPGQLPFDFEPRRPVDGPAAFAGVEARAAAEVGRILKDDPRTREEIAGAVTAAIGGGTTQDGGDTVSRWMLDAYASPARDGHNVSFGRALALMAVTGDRAMIEWAVAQLGGTVLWGEEIIVARIGQLEARKRHLDAELKELKGHAQPIRREGRR